MGTDTSYAEGQQDIREVRTPVWKLGILAIATSMLVVMVTLQSTPYSVARNDHIDRTLGELVARVFPQGWAFFTKTAKEPSVAPYDTSGSSISILPNARPGNIFGISRVGRAQGVEIGYVQQRVEQETEWTDCLSRDVAACAREVAIQHHDKKLPRVNNDLPKSTICGDVVLVEVEPVAYLYRSITDSALKSNRAVAFHAVC